MNIIAKTIVRQEYLFACPNCEKHEFRFTGNISGDYPRTKFFGPWYCEQCGHSVIGEIHPERPEVTITQIRKPDHVRSYVLGRFVNSTTENSLYAVVELTTFFRQNRLLDEELDGLRYLLEEHQCPTNYMRCHAFIDIDGDNYSDDPHGILEFVACVPQRESSEDWDTMFPMLRKDVHPEATAVTINAPMEEILDWAQSCLSYVPAFALDGVWFRSKADAALALARFCGS